MASDAHRAAVKDAPRRARHPEGAKILDDVAAFFASYVAFPSQHAKVAAALWVAHAHVMNAHPDLFDSTARLALLSPEPGSGKTRTLEVIEVLVPNPMHALNASAAPLFRSIEAERPVLLLDEVDGLFGRNGKDDDAKDVRALLNAGHRKGATIPRCVGPRHDVAQFPVFCAVALAGLGDLPDTLMSRSVIVRMRRRAPSEQVRPFRIREAEAEGHELRDRLAGWIERSEKLLRRYPVMPGGVTDRPADCWESLLAVADAAGGHWPDTARAACVELVKVVQSREASLGVRLLGDLKVIFGDARALSTEAILAALCALDEAPWGDLRGQPLDARGLARRLGAYGVKSTKVKLEGASLRGYRREELADAWARYVPTPTTEEAEPAEPPEQGRSEPLSMVPSSESVPEPNRPPEPLAPLLTCEVPEVPEVPHFPGLESNGRGPLGVCAECSTRPATRTSAADRPWCDECWTAALDVTMSGLNGNGSRT